MSIQISAEQKRLVFFALMLSFLETVLFFIGRAVEKDYGMFFGALLIFGFNFLLLLSYRRAE
jgi:hypothetical protein